ncbi:alkaline phosphatase D family protein [Parapontixanthobacter aurantiacus]|nr:alkaline phosphatase D family protein [Parapontixanthobacter aurantiacus]
MKFRLPLATAIALALSACATTGSSEGMQRAAVSASRITTPEEALARYYDVLREEITLPRAPAGASLDPNTVLTRIAFGSCNHQSRSQHMWDRIEATDPQLFMLIGDNVYGDTGWRGDAGLETLRDAYALQSSHSEFVDFRRQVPMLTTWDDHDYGFNDAGASFALRNWSEEIYETYWGSSEEVRSRPGVYESRTFGSDGRVVQIIMLDTRFFRSDLDRLPYSEDRPPLGPYLPTERADATMLGGDQWNWLAQELQKPADLRMIVSSVQVLTDAHDYEAWAALPAERRRLYEMLSTREDSGLVLLSGDRHAGGLYTYAPPAAAGEQFWEITSSSLNLAFSTTAENTAREPDDRRVTDFISEENFGLIDIDWANKALTLSLLGNEGELRAARSFEWTD